MVRFRIPVRISTSRRLHIPVVFAMGAVQVGGCVSGGGRTPLAAVVPDSARADTVHVTTFGDSNTDWGVSVDEPHVVAKSYVSDSPPRIAPGAPNSPAQLAGLIEARWRTASRQPIRVVNHGIAGTTTGGGAHGGADRNRNGAPNAGTVVGGVTRFEGEVLGHAYPWSGGEPAGPAYPTGSIRRVEAYTPGPGDFVYVSLGTNDFADAGMSAAQTLGNLAWMIDGWIRAGHAPDHFVITTLAPRLDRPELVEIIPAINNGIRHLAARTGIGLIDLTAHTSTDDGRTWSDPSMHLADRVHYTTPVRAWIAGQLVTYMAAHQLAATR